ncbi:protein of unknown function [Burkholderia multivorans]
MPLNQESPTDSLARPGGRHPDIAMAIPLNERPISERMRHVADWLSSNLDKPVTVQQAATLAAMSERNLLRHFTREIGTAPRAYLMRVRLERACAMLVATALPADSVARRCGLGNGERLARLFRQHFGETPTEFRRKRHQDASASVPWRSVGAPAETGSQACREMRAGSPVEIARAGIGDRLRTG